MVEAKRVELTGFKHIPSLPHLLLKLIEACNHPEVSIKQISSIIGMDPGLTGKLLRLINSAHFGFPRKISKIEQAVGMLGIEAIRNIAISSSIYEAFQRVPETAEFRLKAFWWHSLRSALLSRLLAQAIRYPNPEEGFLVGLLHDLGRLLLWLNFPEDYGDAVRMSQDRPELLLAVEERLGSAHPALAAALLEHWGLESVFADAVRYHHEPPERIRTALPLVQILYLANALTTTGSPLTWAELEPIAKILGLDAAVVQDRLGRVDQEIAEIAEGLGIEIERSPAAADQVKRSGGYRRERVNRYGQQSALLFAALRNLVQAAELPEVIRELKLALAELFDAPQPLFLIKDTRQPRLNCVTVDPETSADNPAAWFIPLAAESSLPIDSFKTMTPLASFERPADQLSLMDRQLIRQVRKPGIFCQPLACGKDPQGVVVLGLDQSQYRQLNGERDLLNLFAAQAAAKLQSLGAQQLREETVREERLQAFTAMARKIVHEVNNPLTLIKNYLKILDLKLSDLDIQQDEVKIINQEIDRVSELVAGMVSFSQAKAVKLEAVNLNRLLAQLCKLASEPLEANANIRMELQLARDLPLVRADDNALRQVFINLIKNAAEAMPNGGLLRIITRLGGRSLGTAEASAGSGAGWVEVVVEDTGAGIPDGIKNQVFEPYVSTKGDSHSGLGLAIVHGIVKDLNGAISVKSEAGRGTCFVVSLPALTKASDGKSSAR